MKNVLGIDGFANAEALLLLLLIPIYLFWYWRYYRRQRLVIRLSYDPSKLRKPKLDLSFLRVLPRFFQLAAIGLIILAIARPQTARELVHRETPGVDIMLLLDTSGSMETQDFYPNRLEVAKANAVSFVEGRQHDRIGMVLFAESAFCYTPMTLDYDLLMDMIQGIKFDVIPKQGTALGSAIAVAINRMRDSDNPSKIIVLLTDGANNRGEIDPIAASRLAADFDIKVYCIGVGKSIFTQPGSGRKIYSDLDEDVLYRISNNTGGRFFRASDPESLRKIFDEISNMEKAEIQEIVFRQVEDHYPTFLKIAIVLLALSYLLMLSFVYNPLEQ